MGVLPKCRQRCPADMRMTVSLLLGKGLHCGRRWDSDSFCSVFVKDIRLNSYCRKSLKDSTLIHSFLPDTFNLFKLEGRILVSRHNSKNDISKIFFSLFLGSLPSPCFGLFSSWLSSCFKVVGICSYDEVL